jgi:hypothetical protein
MRKESPNGGANRCLAGGEQRVVLTSALGKEVEKEEASAGATLFIGQGERGGGPSPARWCQDAGGLPDWLDRGMALGPLSLVTDQWASVSVFKPGVSPNGCGLHCSSIRPVNNWFSIFPIELNL